MTHRFSDDRTYMQTPARQNDTFINEIGKYEGFTTELVFMMPESQ